MKTGWGWLGGWGARWKGYAVAVLLGLRCLLVSPVSGFLPQASSPTPQVSPSTPHAPGPARIISLIPSVTEMLFAIGAGDAVVGVSTFDHYPHDVETRTKVGGLLDPDFERILSLRPDLVVVYGTQSGLIERLARAHVPMFNYEHAGLADVTRTLRQIGARVGRAEAGNRLALDIEKRLTDIQARIGGRPRPRTMIVFEREPGALRGIFASGGVGFLHDILETAGGTNVFADVRRQSLQVTSELALARAPEVILEIRAGPEWTPARAASERNVWRALASMPAVRTGRIYLLTDEVMSIPGPRVPEAALEMARRLHPDIFK
jgi:iron complex transport system substrate-binding protein